MATEGQAAATRTTVPLRTYYDEGGVTIFHGDCREIAPQLAYDVVITDPPYGIGYESGWSADTRTHAASITGDDSTESRDGVVMARVADGVPTACFATLRCVPPIEPLAILIWDKGDAAGMGDLSIPWKPNAEAVWIYGRGWVGQRTTSVLRGPTMVTSSMMGRLHPHQKPDWLIARLIEKAPPGVILDPFMGSGSTLVAAKNLGRKAIGIEIEERYCEIAAKRLAQGVLNFGASA